MITHLIALTSYSLSSRIGTHPTLADEASLRGVIQIATDVGITDDFATQLTILRKLTTLTQYLQLQSDMGLRDSLILMAAGEMETFRTTSRSKWTPETELHFLGAKLFLYGWSFSSESTSEPDILPFPTPSEPTLSKKLILYEALATSTAYIHSFSKLSDPAPTSSNVHSPPKTASSHQPQIHFPKHYFFTFYFAALTLYHILSTLPDLSISDQDLARNHIRLTHTILTCCALDNSDLQWARLAHNIEFVSQFTNSGRRLPPEAQIKSRLGAGLFYDAMLKIAVIKGEKGEKSRGSDLMAEQSSLHDYSRLQVDEQSVLGNGHEDSSYTTGAEGLAVYARENGIPNQQYIPPQEWDEGAFWGWDLAMIESVDFQVDWNGLAGWQP